MRVHDAWPYVAQYFIRRPRAGRRAAAQDAVQPAEELAQIRRWNRAHRQASESILCRTATTRDLRPTGNGTHSSPAIVRMGAPVLVPARSTASLASSPAVKWDGSSRASLTTYPPTCQVRLAALV
jgi:hypothetical protein